MNLDSGVSFHESSLVGSSSGEGTIILQIEGARRDGIECDLCLHLNGVKTVAQDGIETENFEGGGDGEILTLDLQKNALYMIVEWTDWDTRKSQTCSYKIGYESFEIDCSDSGQVK